MARRMTRRLAVVAASAALAALAGCGSTADRQRPLVVVTTPVLGGVVSEVVGTSADVEVLLPNGADPHDYQPSARDTATLGDAALVVANGAELEEGLASALEAAEADGIPVFTATDHVDLIGADDDERRDPHIFLDPARMAGIAAPLGDALADAGVPVGDAPERAASRLQDLDREVRTAVAQLPERRPRIVTGHESLAYYAERYGFEVVATVVPNLSTSAQVSAADLADLTNVIERERVRAIFTEPDTAGEVAAAISDETGAEVVTVYTESFGPGVTSYPEFLTELTATIVGGLSGGPASTR